LSLSELSWSVNYETKVVSRFVTAHRRMLPIQQLIRRHINSWNPIYQKNLTKISTIFLSSS